jgi:hypothetical protein
LFTPQAAAEFAAVIGVANCTAAIHILHGQVTNPSAYANATVPLADNTGPDKDGVAWVNGCDLQVNTGMFQWGPPGGPKLGQLRMEKDPRFHEGGYLITGYTRWVRRVATRRHTGPSAGGTGIRQKGAVSPHRRWWGW